jgi:TonB-linked SusC/RagA family outer membrane protein
MTSVKATRVLTVAVAAALLAGARVAHAQNSVITGEVVSDLGQPLEGANVFIQELSVSVATNQAGRYTISIPDVRATGQQVALRVRYIGHLPQSRQITLSKSASQTQNFSLKVDVTKLAEVVVTGVAEGTERAKLPFTVAKVDASDLPAPAVDPLSQIAGRVPGANIKSTSGRPGAAPQVLLRAPTSIDGSGRGQDPLYIVDGIILTGGLPELNPSDIQSVEVVKGAAAASLYGARAGAGVISITTKNGRQNIDNSLNFNVRTEYGRSDIEHYFGLAENHIYKMNEDGTRFCGNSACTTTFDWMEEIIEINSVPTATPAPIPAGSSPVNNGTSVWNTFQASEWPGRTYSAIDQVVDPGSYQQSDVQVTGRFDNTSFFSSLGYLDQQGSFLGLSGYQRGSIRLNVDQELGDEWSFSVNTYYSHSRGDGRGQEGGSFFDLTRMPRGVNLLAKDTVQGQYIIKPDLNAENENPVYALVYQRRLDETDRFLGGLNATYRPSDWFDVKANLSYDRSNTQYSQFNDKGFRTARSSATNLGQVFESSESAQSYNGSLTASLRHSFRPDLHTLLQARYLVERQDFSNADVTGRSLLVRNVPDMDNVRGPDNIFPASGESSVRQVGYFLIGNIDFKDRYILDGLIRRDGASVFGADNRWATFGRLALAWRPTEEPWFNVPGVDELKVRYSVGTAGNRPRFSAQYEVYAIGNGTFVPLTAGNSELGVEKVREQEMGVDALLFGRLGAAVTYSNVVTKDQILRVPLPAASGFQFQWQNAGTLEGNTFEASLDLPIVRRKDLTFSTRIQYDRSRATITDLTVAPFQYGAPNQGLEAAFYAREGERLGTVYGTRWARGCADLPSGTDCSLFRRNSDGYFVWTNGMDVGSGAARDENGDIVVAPNTWGTAGPVINGKLAMWGTPVIASDEDGNTYLPLGNTLPDYRLAFSQTFTFKKFAATALFDGAFGQEVYNQGRHWSYFENYSHDQDQAGRSDEELKPIGYYGSTGLYDVLQPNSHFVEDASYVKLRELTLSYRLGRVAGAPGDWTLSLIGRNLKTWTDYTGFDPEVGIASSGSTTQRDTGSGVLNAFDAFRFPNLRTITFALQASF